MTTRTETLSRAEQALALCANGEAEAVLVESDNSLTRFANNVIHQNVAGSDASLSIRIARGKRVGIAFTNDLTAPGMKAAVERASAIAAVAPENPDFPGFPQPQPVPAPSANAYHLRTAEAGPDERAAAVAIACRMAERAGLRAAGAYSTSAFDMAVANSNGLRAGCRYTLAEYSMVTQSDDSSGYADRIAMDHRRIDPEAIAQESIERALRSMAPIELPPGRYTVVLEPYAVSDIMDFFAYLGLGALAVQEGRSFMSGKLGQRLLGENVSLWDDGLDPGGVPLPIDFEGVPKRRVDFVAKGVARGPCYDSTTALKEDRASTGHAMPPGETYGPLPMNLFLGTGDSSREAMITSTERGILVTRFWYTRTVHPAAIVVTGTTRDGTFLIENGKVTRPIRNLRFTQSYVEALNNVQAISRESRLVRSMFSFNRAPCLKIGSWDFTGVTQY